MENQIRAILSRHGKLSTSADTVGVEDDLYSLGLTSHASVNVMLAIEDEFDIEFPDEVLTKSTFATIANLRGVVDDLRADA